MHSNPALLALAASASILAAPLQDENLQKYFARQVEQISANCLADIDSRQDWEEARPRLRAQLFEMLSLDPLPERGDLKPVITGKVERDDFVVEKLHFQSSPHLYVTANFYLPKKIDKPLPTILYVCGHGPVKTNGVSYGNKVAYQHHGAWFARNGYACLIIDTIQLGEIEGLHHGTYREGMWWWNSRGYTPAGVEAWNCIRALDYLETRPEVDKSRFGVTGRSGGGAYSWWVAALDDRIKVAAPVAGITDLQNHVVDGCVEGHCDCMFFVNTYRWDYPAVAALVAPRPLLICNSDKDSIFPLDGVQRTHAKVARIYKLLDATNNLGLLITEGPHKDTQDLQLPVFRWFNRHLKGEDPVIEMAATKFFTGQELKVFDQLPKDEITSKIHETFVPAAKPNLKPDQKRLTELRAILREKVFRGWPRKPVPFNAKVSDPNHRWKEVQFDSEEGVRLKMFYIPKPSAGLVKNRTRLMVTDAEPDLDELDKSNQADAVLVVRPGPAPDSKDRRSPHIRRRYNLVGQTLDGMRVWDIIRGLEMLKQSEGGGRSLVLVSGDPRQSANALLASIMIENPGSSIYVYGITHQSDADRPDYLNLLRFTNWNELKALASPIATGEKKS